MLNCATQICIYIYIYIKTLGKPKTCVSLKKDAQHRLFVQVISFRDLRDKLVEPEVVPVRFERIGYPRPTMMVRWGIY